jgi:hypothetical protein
MLISWQNLLSYFISEYLFSTPILCLPDGGDRTSLWSVVIFRILNFRQWIMSKENDLTMITTPFHQILCGLSFDFVLLPVVFMWRANLHRCPSDSV